MKTDTAVKTVTITEILQKLTNSDDFRDFDGSPESYMMMIVDKVTGRPSVPQLIREDIPTDRFDPVQLLVNPDGTWRMGDGHHRFITALLRADDTLPVVHTYDDPATTAHMMSSYREFSESDYSDARWLAEQIGQEYADLLKDDALV